MYQVRFLQFIEESSKIGGKALPWNVRIRFFQSGEQIMPRGRLGKQEPHKNRCRVEMLYRCAGDDECIFIHKACIKPWSMAED
jgi:hypothetical protein